MTEILNVATTTPDHESAQRLAASAVRSRLAASAQVVGPIETAFWHLGEFGTGVEWQVNLKTTTDRYEELQAHLLAEHPWDNPDLTATTVVACPPRYLEWARAATREPASS